MTKTIVLSMCLAISALSLDARAQDRRGYGYGPVTEVDYIHVEYGHFDEYMAWVTSTWVPTMEAAAYAGDIGDQADAFEAVTEKVICNSACQNQARVHRNEIRKVLGIEVTREVVFK